MSTTQKPITILHVSDLHLTAAAPLPPAPAVNEVSLVLVTGDVANGFETPGDLGLPWGGKAIVRILDEHLFPRDRFPRARIVFVPGNHDRYGEGWDECMRRWREQASTTDRVTVLQEDILDHAGWRILGTTLWSSAMLPDDRDPAPFIADFQCPPAGHPGHWSVADHRAAHDRSRRWLTEALRHGDPARTLVATHWIPGAPMIAGVHRNDPLNGYFAADLPVRTLAGAHLWLFGHTHIRTWGHLRGPSDRGWYGANPRGYHNEMGMPENQEPYALRRIRLLPGSAPECAAVPWPTPRHTRADVQWWETMLDSLARRKL